RGQTTGVTYDGGYGEYMIAPASAVALMPADLPAVEAAPLMCAGLTTFNALRNSGARPGDVVAVLGLGGLGHLGVQYAAKMGFHTVGIARGKDKGPLLRDVGRFAGHARLQHAGRGAADERNLPVRESLRGLRPHDERQGAVSSSLDHRALAPALKTCRCEQG